MNESVVTYAKRVQSLGFAPVPIVGTEKKPPSSFPWTDLRDGIRSALTKEEIENIFSNPEVERVAIILNYRSFLIDYDGKLGQFTLWNDIMPRCSKELQRLLRSTTHTKTPHGGHILVTLDGSAFPDGIEEMLCWQMLNDGHANSNGEIRVLSQKKYSIEYGNGYESIRKIQEVVTLSVEQSTELVEIFRRFKSESIAIRNIANIMFPYWIKERRQDLALAISGYLYKNKIPDYMAQRLVQYLVQFTDDEEASRRLDAVNYTYAKQEAEVSGYNRLVELVDENESIIMKIREQFEMLGYLFFYDGDHDKGKARKRKVAAGKNGDDDNDNVKLSAKVIKMLEPKIELSFKNEFDTAFAAIYVNEHREIVPIHKSKRFNLWVRKVYYDTTCDTIGNEILNEVAETLEAKALFEGPIKPLELRISKDPNNELKWWYDLCNDKWEVVQIGVDGWQIVKSAESPIMFRRRSGHQSQVYPVKDYDADVLNQFIELLNLKDDPGIRLIFKCYLIALLIPGIAKPALMVHDPKGAAKTTCQDLTKLLIDPSKATNLTLPKDTQQLAQQLEHNFLIYYDNVSILRERISNDLCRAVTGTANSKRELYTDDDDVIYQYRRPIGFNGLNLTATRGDLLDRGLIIDAERIEENKRRRLQDILLDLERIKPQLLGYIFDILVKVLQIKARGGIIVTSMSRLADFETDCEIIARCRGYPDGEFLKAYRTNRDVASSVVIEGSQVAKAIIELMNDKETWSGTATTLLANLENAAGKLRIDTIKDKSWPKGANVLSRRLTEIKVDLESADISISTTENTKTKTKTIVLCKISPEQPDSQNAHSKSAHLPGAIESCNKLMPDESPAQKSQDGAQIQDSGDSGDSGCSFQKIKEDSKPTYEYLEQVDMYRCKLCKLIYDVSTKDTIVAHRCNFIKRK